MARRTSAPSKTKSVQAPTGGLNAKDPLASMKETEAVTLDNFFPTPSSVDIRNGYENHVTGITGNVDTLATYSAGNGSQLFAVANGSIFDVSSAGTVGSALVTGLSNSRFQHVNMGTAGGNFLVMVNGQDKMRIYNGTTWDFDGGTLGITVTGFDTSNAIHINNFKNRIFLIEKDTMNAWYLPVSSLGGAAQKLDLSGLFKLGGYLMAMANWTIDNASGIDDYAAFVTSEGEVALYKGTNPSSASEWAMVGTFRMGKPVGRRCFCKASADVLMVTTDGAFPLSKALLTDRAQTSLAATNKIQTIFNADVTAYNNNFGWQPIIYPDGQKLLINVPIVENNESYQYVMNTEHGAWTRFTGWSANCFEVFGNGLYYGGNGVVCRADYGQSDNDSNILAVAQQAFNYFGNPNAIKQFKMVRPVFMSSGYVNPSVLMNVDFQQKRTTSPPSFTDNSGTAWDVGDWDISPWTSGDSIIQRWQTVTGIGYCGGIRVVQDSKNLTCKWISTDIVYEQGGVL